MLIGRSLIQVLVVWVTLSPPLPAQERAELTEELRVLEATLGTWNEVVRYEPAAWTPEGSISRSVTTKRSALGGRYIFHSGIWQPPNTEFLNIITYDRNAGEFRTWYFDATGAFTPGPMRGQWDAQTHSLIWTSMDAAGNTSRGTSTVVDDQHNEWTMVTKDAAGTVLLDVHGKLSRRSER